MTPEVEPPDCWYAGFVPRWHAGAYAPWLARSGDACHGHAGRMAMLALHFWGAGCSWSLLAACITHDAGEIVAGDAPQAAKADPELAALLDRIEGRARAAMGVDFGVLGEDARRLGFLDRLDAFLWAQHHAPGLMAAPAWRGALVWLRVEALGLGVEI